MQAQYTTRVIFVMIAISAALCFHVRRCSDTKREAWKGGVEYGKMIERIDWGLPLSGGNGSMLWGYEKDAVNGFTVTNAGEEVFCISTMDDEASPEHERAVELWIEALNNSDIEP